MITLNEAHNMADVLKNLEQDLNFTTTIYNRVDEEWGRKDANGTWTGMVLSLLKEEMDFASSSFTINIPR